MLIRLQLIAHKFGNAKILTTNSTNIYFNLATEQYLFEKASLNQPTLFLWRNSPTIVIGRHQNPWKQCRNQQMKANNILLSRRKTGGGAVYHDLGNTCFSFLTPYKSNEQYDYKTVNNQILIKTFKQLGIQAQVSGRNDITCQGKKISGSAYRLYLGGKDGIGRKALHHGTVLFSIDLQALQKYLNPNKKKLESKGINSIISRVMNLNENHPNVNHQTFSTALQRQFSRHYGESVEYEILDFQNLRQNIPQIQTNYQRLQSWDWLYGQCPEFKYSIDKKFDWGMTQVTYNVQDGIIKQCKIYSDCLYPDFITIANEEIVKDIKYDKLGLIQFENNLIARIEESWINMATSLCEWMRQQL